jgi:type VI secretion system protein ImpJ
LQRVDYLVLQLLNRQIPVLHHFRQSGFVHPERLYEELLRLAVELATFARPNAARVTIPPPTIASETSLRPDPRHPGFLSARLGRRAIRLEIQRRRTRSSADSRPSLLRNATLVLEVAAHQLTRLERFSASLQDRLIPR